jgi:DNA-binding transcriptional LysR family regulator
MLASATTVTGEQRPCLRLCRPCAPPQHRALGQSQLLRGALSASAPFDPARVGGVLRVAATEHAMSAIVQRVLAAVRRQAPGLEVSVEPAGADVFELLAAGRFDVLFAPKVGPTPSRPRPRHHRVGRPGRAGRLLRRSRSGCARAVGRLPRYSSNVSEDERKLCFEILFASVAARPDTREVFAHEA